METNDQTVGQCDAPEMEVEIVPISTSPLRYSEKDFEWVLEELLYSARQHLGFMADLARQDGKTCAMHRIYAIGSESDPNNDADYENIDRAIALGNWYAHQDLILERFKDEDVEGIVEIVINQGIQERNDNRAAGRAPQDHGYTPRS